MKKILIDTNIYSDAMRGKGYAVDILKRNEQLLFSPIVIGELLSGFKRGNQEEKNKRELKDFLSRERVYELSISSDTSEFYAFILEQLKKQGTQIPTNDIWIAASAMENGAAIASRDEHFLRINGIMVIAS
ncbi:MAG: type II toxin-antitoxin system VapC family toxin [Candidatus Aminicenantes bacterium]|jgi:predicted nucleic acid-binding protein|nr:type II toxin-antitoxin system VapC family toxin [Candidatus Aminicenantes bacterium]